MYSQRGKFFPNDLVIRKPFINNPHTHITVLISSLKDRKKVLNSIPADLCTAKSRKSIWWLNKFRDISKNSLPILKNEGPFES